MTHTTRTDVPGSTVGRTRGWTDGAIRASDDEREAALQDLGRHFATGRLDRAEFDERSEAAFAARTRADLRRLFADLPEGSPRPDARTPRRGDSRLPGGVPLIAVASVLVAVAFTLTLVTATSGHPVFPFPVIPVVFILLRRPWRWNRKAGTWR
jgi:hypothetical protein